MWEVALLNPALLVGVLTLLGTFATAMIGLIGHWLMRRTALGQQTRSSESALIDDLAAIATELRTENKALSTMWLQAKEGEMIANAKLVNLENNLRLKDEELRRASEKLDRYRRERKTTTPEPRRAAMIVPTSLDDDTSSVEMDFEQEEANDKEEAPNARNRK